MAVDGYRSVMDRIRQADWSGFGETMKAVREDSPHVERHVVKTYESEEEAFESILWQMGYPPVVEFDSRDDWERQRFYAYWRRRMDELGKPHS